MGFPKFIWAQNSFLYRASPVISDLQTEFWNIGKGKDEIFSLLSAPPPPPPPGPVPIPGVYLKSEKRMVIIWCL